MIGRLMIAKLGPSIYNCGMKFPAMKSFIGFSTIVFLFASCVSPEESVEDSNTLRPKVNTNINADLANVNSNANVAEDDLLKLKDIINLPFEPEFNDYRQEPLVESVSSNRVPGPTDKKLTVVLKFSAKDTEKLMTELKKSKKPPFETETEAEDWFPAELIAKRETSGDGTLKGVGYSSEKFTKTPFNTGTLIYIKDTDYFVLILQTQ